MEDLPLMIRKIYAIFYLFIVASMLTGCGGENNKTDNIAPSITLNGSKHIELTVSDRYIDLGARAFDNSDGNITAKIIVNKQIDTSKVGRYVILYSVADKNGNSSSVEREIIVKKKPNRIPVVEAGNGKTVILNNLFTLTGSAIDSDGEVVSYSWKESRGNIVSHEKDFSQTLATLGNFIFTFEAEDDIGAVSSDTVVVKSVLESDYLNQEKLEPIKRRIANASATDVSVAYVVAGDSKRDYAADYQTLYTQMLQQFNVEYKHNALAGITAQQWASRTDDTVAGIAKTVKDAAGNEGSLTIVEYSLGANDWNKASNDGIEDLYAEIYPHIKKGITEIQKKLPNAKIFLVNPIGSHRPELKKVYRDIAQEFNLPMMENPMDKYRDNIETKDDYFYDSIHPNEIGAKRLVYNILYNITDSEPQKKIIEKINQNIEIFF